MSKNQVLRFPSGLNKSNFIHKKFMKSIEDLFGKTEIEVIIIGHNRLGLKIITKETVQVQNEPAVLFSTMCTAWIRYLIEPMLGTQPETTEYSADVMIDGKTYSNVFPISNLTNENGQFLFVYHVILETSKEVH